MNEKEIQELREVLETMGIQLYLVYDELNVLAEKILSSGYCKREAVLDEAIERINEKANRHSHSSKDFIFGLNAAHDILESLKTTPAKVDKCVWKYNENDSYYNTTCGAMQYFPEDFIEDSKFKYCPYCGREIKTKGGE